MTGSSAPSYGALIQFHSPFVVVNKAGCVALAEPCNLSCAQAMLAPFACQGASCGPSCSDSAGYQACETDALSCASCGAYTAAASACTMQLSGAQHPAAAFCALTSTTFQASYTAVATFMCGS
jgi:hypothetical protein